ncbi:hypothetical protein CC78DRAFT_588462 [Lojkania enalia]|uniref:Uncharacterized protein n=1 Tax=Lojkania enalia TaxID=147567 RepID=A0A9P4JXI0_9PLEO|nr:hypothetical protein CC78DRAFT_588462 [Didymosphaeria enalia]
MSQMSCIPFSPNMSQPAIKEEHETGFEPTLFLEHPNRGAEPAVSPFTTAPEPAQPQNLVALNTRWPSQVVQSTSTMWLLPPCTDQSSAIATLLRTEIESHNITREMLHATENRRIEAAQQAKQLMDDCHRWNVAYNSLTTALHACSEEYSRLNSENITLKKQLQESNAYTFSQPTFRLDAAAPMDKQIRVLKRKLSRLSKEGSEAGSEGESEEVNGNRDADAASWEYNLCIANVELEDTPCLYTS